jgi:hypothetical protein
MLSMTSPKDGRTLRTVQMRETDFGRKTAAQSRRGSSPRARLLKNYAGGLEISCPGGAWLLLGP